MEACNYNKNDSKGFNWQGNINKTTYAPPALPQESHPNHGSAVVIGSATAASVEI